MAHARLTHPTRPTLEFRQAQTDDETTEAVTNIASDLGTGNPPLVHVETRERSRSIQGRVTAPRRARNDADTSDWEQSLANYLDRLESHVDELQGFGGTTGEVSPGSGYTLVDDERDESLNVVYHRMDWTLKNGQPYDVEFSLDLTVGRGTFDNEPIERRNPTVQSDMDVAARVGGVDLTGLRQMQVSREFDVETMAVYNPGSAENNDVKATGGTQQQIVFEGTLTGTRAEREAAEDSLRGLEDGSRVSFETRFPGYSLDGFVTSFESGVESRFGTRMHQFTLQFMEGEKA